MHTNLIVVIAKQYIKKTFNTKGLFVLLFLFCALLFYTTISSWSTFKLRQDTVKAYQQKSRSSWESNPDKHPHRMAHFGSFVFRLQHPLSIFDSGIDTYVGNSIYLEAHKQNTANFSEAALSTSLVRFGDLNMAILLQLILPLIIFFMGYSSITQEREHGTLKIMYLQGATFKQIILGKGLGLFLITLLFLLPGFIALWIVVFLENNNINYEIICRGLLITTTYTLFFVILCLITVIISAISKNSNTALLSVLGGWLLFFIVIPKASLAVGSYLNPNITKIEFRDAFDAEIAKKGDSHNPDDPFFNQIRDSILKANKVTNIKALPFNYGGFLMRKGESQTSQIYGHLHKKLIATYHKQNSIANRLALLNPYLAIKNLSTAFSGTDFYTYTNFLDQTENYRYKQSQYVNNLQIKFISNNAKGSEGKVHVVNKKHWKLAPKFTYKFLPMYKVVKQQVVSILALGVWLLLIIVIITTCSNRFKII